MVERNSTECNSPNIYPNLNAIPLNDQQQFRLNKVSKIRDYFIGEIKKRELMSKRLVNILLLLTILISN